MSWDEVVGKCVRLWFSCHGKASGKLLKNEADHLVDHVGFSDALCHCGLAILDGENAIKMKGFDSRLSKFSNKSEQRKLAGIRSGEARRAKNKSSSEPKKTTQNERQLNENERVVEQNERVVQHSFSVCSSVLKSLENPDERKKSRSNDVPIYISYSDSERENTEAEREGSQEGRVSENLQNDFTFPGEQVKNSSPPTKLKPKPPSGEHQTAIAEYFTGFEAKYGTKPDFGAGDARLVAMLLKSHGLEQFRKKLFIAFEQTPEWPPSPWDMRQIKMHWNKLVEAKTLPAKKLSFDSPIDYVAIGTPGRAMK